MINTLARSFAILSFAGCLIFGTIWIWFMTSWAQASCIVCVAILSICYMIMERKEQKYETYKENRY